MNLTCMLLLAAVLFAGCAEDGGKQADPPSATSSTSQVSDSTNQPPPVITDSPALSNSMQWSSCHGLYTKFYFPGPLNPAADFEGWYDRDPYLPTEISLLVFECERFGFRQVERGPMRFVVEITNDRRPPDGCLFMEPEGQPFNVLGIWSSDPEVVEELRSEGMPAGLADIAFALESSPSLHAASEWVVDGESSSLEVRHESASQTLALAPRPWRLFWHNPFGGVSAVDFGQEVNGPGPQPERPVSGILGAPMTMAGPYAGPGFHFTDSDFGGPITRFQDVECKSPA